MKKFNNLLLAGAVHFDRLKSDRRAVTALEYGLVASVIVVTIMAAFGVMASNLSGTFVRIGDAL